MKAGVVDESGRPRSAVSLPAEVERGQAFGLKRMGDAIQAALEAAGVSAAEVAAVGVAAPGLADIPAGVILEAANLPGWRDVAVRQHVADAFGRPTAFQNDANAAALGELWVGAGRGARSLVLFTLGTGIGGGLVVDGAVIEGAHSHAGELGHVRVELTQPRPCGCGRLGCLEAYASATSVARRATEALARDGDRSLLHAHPTELTARDVFDAAAAGDALAGRVVEETAYYLAVGATNLMHILDPEVVVFAGGMIAAGDGFLESIRSHVRRMAFPTPAQRTLLCYTSLGPDAGFIGAAACGRQLVHGRAERIQS